MFIYESLLSVSAMTQALETDPHAPEFRLDLGEQSAANSIAISSSYIDEAVAKGQFANADAARGALAEREAAVTAEHALTVNMTAQGLDRFLRVGSLETVWDYAREGGEPKVLGVLAVVNGKDMSGGYEDARAVAESGLRQYAPADAPRHAPLYAALAGPRERETGAAPSYGKCWIAFGGSVAERAVYVFSDSMAAVSEGEGGLAFDAGVVLTAEDAITAKAVVDLVDAHHAAQGVEFVGGGMARNANPDELMTVAGRKPGYVEAAIFDEVALENVAIGMALDNPADLAGAGQVFQQHPELSGRASVYCSEGISDVVVDWLGQRVATKVGEAIYDPAGVSGLWGSLGLQSSASYEEVEIALNRRAALSLRDLVALDPSFPRLADYQDPLQWDSYVKTLQTVARNMGGEARGKVDELIAMQQARVFFRRPQTR